VAQRWQIAGPGHLHAQTLPEGVQRRYKELMRDVQKDPEHCPRARPMKGVNSFYASFGSYTAAFEVRADAHLIWVSHVAAIDVSKSIVRPRATRSPDPPAIL
jgi:hypothetical protein